TGASSPLRFAQALEVLSIRTGLTVPGASPSMQRMHIHGPRGLSMLAGLILAAALSAPARPARAQAGGDQRDPADPPESAAADPAPEETSEADTAPDRGDAPAAPDGELSNDELDDIA